MNKVLLQSTGLAQRDHRVDQRSLAQIQFPMLQFFVAVVFFGPAVYRP